MDNVNNKRGGGSFRESRQIFTSLSCLFADVFELLHNVRIHGAHSHGTDDKSDAVHPVGIFWMHVVASLAGDQATVAELQRVFT